MVSHPTRPPDIMTVDHIVIQPHEKMDTPTYPSVQRRVLGPVDMEVIAETQNNDGANMALD